jgi:protein-S-isoprenylcysteine O-methyltransferase Ste14
MEMTSPDITTPIVACLGLACFVAFSWALKGHFRASHFRATGTMPMGMKLIGALSLLGLLIFLWQLRDGVAAWPVVAGLFALALVLFSWTVHTTRFYPPTLAFDTDLPQILFCQGPYQHVRHPFYLSYMLFWAGTATGAATPSAWAVPLVMGAIYYKAALQEEQKFACSDLAPDYDVYRRQAGMFLPRWPVRTIKQKESGRFLKKAAQKSF